MNLPQELTKHMTWYQKGITYETMEGGHKFAIRINDFPAEPLYTLIKDDKVQYSFNEWPTTWIIIPADE